MALALSDQISYLREAGEVARCHTLPHAHGSYTVASHSWHAAILLLKLHPSPSAELLAAVLTHDVGERFSGDIPLQARKQSRSLQEADTAYSHAAFQLLGVNLVPLSEEDLRWIGVVDALEFYLWCEDELEGRGNRHIWEAHSNIVTYIDEAIAAGQWPESAVEFYEPFQWQRMADYPEGLKL